MSSAVLGTSTTLHQKESSVSIPAAPQNKNTKVGQPPPDTALSFSDPQTTTNIQPVPVNGKMQLIVQNQIKHNSQGASEPTSNAIPDYDTDMSAVPVEKPSKPTSLTTMEQTKRQTSSDRKISKPISDEERQGRALVAPRGTDSAINRAGVNPPTPNDTETVVFSRGPSDEDSGIADLTDDEKRLLIPLHEEFKQGLEIEHENKLAKEIRAVYCELSSLKRIQTMTMAQSNGILAATILGLPECSRLQGMGQSLMLQECTKKETTVTAVETTCGFQPLITYNSINYTIGTDGWSLHPYSSCFWKSQLVNLNGKSYHWEFNSTFGDWVEQIPNVHSHTLDLIAEFDQLPLKDFDFELKAHPAHETSNLEQMNILNELMGKIQESRSNALSQFVMSESQDNSIGNLFSWTYALNIIVIVIISSILLAIVIKLFIMFQPVSRIINAIRKRRQVALEEAEAPAELLQPMLTRTKPVATTPYDRNIYPSILNASAPRLERHPTIIHSHTAPTYVVGQGLLWEDGCLVSE